MSTEPNEPSKKPGEAAGRDTSEIKAAQKPLDGNTDSELLIDQGVDNPVARATQHESKDPYAEGKHISNPEPNNGAGEDGRDLDPTETDEPEETDADEESETATEEDTSEEASAADAEHGVDAEDDLKPEEVDV